MTDVIRILSVKEAKDVGEHGTVQIRRDVVQGRSQGIGGTRRIIAEVCQTGTIVEPTQCAKVVVYVLTINALKRRTTERDARQRRTQNARKGDATALRAMETTNVVQAKIFATGGMVDARRDIGTVALLDLAKRPSGNTMLEQVMQFS